MVATQARPRELKQGIPFGAQVAENKEQDEEQKTMDHGESLICKDLWTSKKETFSLESLSK